MIVVDNSHNYIVKMQKKIRMSNHGNTPIFLRYMGYYLHMLQYKYWLQIKKAQPTLDCHLDMQIGGIKR